MQFEEEKKEGEEKEEEEEEEEGVSASKAFLKDNPCQSLPDRSAGNIKEAILNAAAANLMNSETPVTQEVRSWNRERDCSLE